MMITRKHVLILIVLAQFACVSLWFAGNGVMNALIAEFNLPVQTVGHLTSSVQFGFILGTLVYAILAFADKFSPSTVFFVSALASSLSNLGLIMSGGDITILYGARFLTGFFLAGIYPVGMKIASDYFDHNLGKALGWLLGALVLGTAFPHLLSSLMESFEWEDVVLALSVLAILGGMLIFFLVPDGPFRKKGIRFNQTGLIATFKDRNFRSAAFGYFGHMWELYSFWTFIPFIVVAFIAPYSDATGDVSLFNFEIIAIGAIGCIMGGYMSQRMGSYRVAFVALGLSAACCLLSPLIFTLNPAFIFLFLLFWGMVVIMDSPQFSTLIAQSYPLPSIAT